MLTPIADLKPGDVILSPARAKRLEVQIVAATWIRVFNIDSGILSTLPKACWKDGMAEKIASSLTDLDKAPPTPT